MYSQLMTVLSFAMLFLSLVTDGLIGGFALYGAGLTFGLAMINLLNAE